MSQQTNSRAYEVGRGRPPKHSRFQKGRSGNPTGRPKASRDLQTELKEELSELVTMNVRGRQIRVTKLRALLKKTCAKASEGDMRAMALLLNWLPPVSSDQRSQPKDFAAEDNAIIDSAVRALAGKPKREAGHE